MFIRLKCELALLIQAKSSISDHHVSIYFMLEKEMKPPNGEVKEILTDSFVQCNEIRKINMEQIVIGKMTDDNEKEELDNDADDDDADNAEESEGDEFEQETG